MGLLSGRGPEVGGQVRFGDDDLLTLSEAQLRERRGRDLGMVFQDPLSSLDPRQSVESLLTEGLRAHGLSGGAGADRARLAELMDAVGLPAGALRRYPHAYSGGQRQRIGIARALCVEPDLIVADEPVSALDVSVQAQVLNVLSRLQRELGLTYLVIAHDLAVVRHVSDRVGVMYLGGIVEEAVARTRRSRTTANGSCSPATCPHRPLRRRAAGSTPAAPGARTTGATPSVRSCAFPKVRGPSTGWHVTTPRPSGTAGSPGTRCRSRPSTRCSVPAPRPGSRRITHRVPGPLTPGRPPTPRARSRTNVTLVALNATKATLVPKPARQNPRPTRPALASWWASVTFVALNATNATLVRVRARERQRMARLIAETTPFRDALVMLLSIPTPQKTLPSTAHST